MGNWPVFSKDYFKTHNYKTITTLITDSLNNGNANMNTDNPTTPKTETKPVDVKSPTDKAVQREISKKQFLSKSGADKNHEPTVKTVEIKAKKYNKKPKTVTLTVILDSFPFPEKDYSILSGLKKACIADGTPVKRGEILRAGLHLLAKLSLPELKLALDKVEKIQPKQAKTANIFETKH
jgi:hypothetical protein